MTQTVPFPPRIAVGSLSLASLLAPAGDRTADELRRIAGVERKLGPGDSLFEQDDECASVYVLLDGWVMQQHLLEDGSRQILDFALPGTLLGSIYGGRTNYGAQALTRCRVAPFPRYRFLEALGRSPHLALQVAIHVSQTLTLSHAHLARMGRCSALARIAHLLCELTARIRERSPGPERDPVALPLAQADIGDALGLTPVHVNRMLQVLRRDGLVATGLRSVSVLDPERLACRAGLDAGADGGWMPTIALLEEAEPSSTVRHLYN